MIGHRSTRAVGRIATGGIGGVALLFAAHAGEARGRAAPPPTSRAVALVPVATVLNEVKCDYLDFAYSDYARQQRLAVGKVRGELRLTVSRIGTAAALGVPVAPADLRLDERASATAASGNGLTVPFDMDPSVALNPGGAGLDCAAGKRLSRTILDFTQLAAQFVEARRLAPALTVRSPLHYRGQFMLRQGPGGVDVVLVTVDPARLGADAAFLQTFDLVIETGAPSWFADVGPATAEPHVAARVEPDATPRIELRAVDVPPPRTGRRVLRVPTAPRPAGAPPARRCVADVGGEIACY